MKQLKFLLLAGYLSMAIQQGRADFMSPTPNRWSTTSENGKYHFQISPDDNFESIMSMVSPNGTKKIIWRGKNWYAYRGFVSNDGQYLVGLGDPMFPSHSAPEHDCAILFVRNGKLLKKYLVSDLVDKKDLTPTISHYLWQPAKQGVKNGFHPEGFKLVTIDKTIHIFDLNTGERTSHDTKDPEAKSSREIREEELEKEKTEGMKRFESAKWRSDFEKWYRFTDISLAENASIFGLPRKFDNPWSADLIPLKKREIDVLIELVCKATNRQLEMKFSPEKFDEVITQALANPKIKNRIKQSGGFRLRMRVLSDRLHWNADDLKEITGKKSSKNWVQFILDTRKPGHDRYTRIFYLPESERVIFN